MYCFKLLVVLISFQSIALAQVFDDNKWITEENGDRVYKIDHIDVKKIEEARILSGQSLTKNEDLSEFKTYVVKSGDSLQTIAEELYGDKGRWKEIYVLNQKQIAEKKLFIGMILKVKNK